MSSQKRVLLVILDGWGHGLVRRADAISLAKTPFVDSLYTKYPSAELVTHGELVGLPEGQMGNSEVGHMNIGAGRIVYQELTRISKAIRDKELHQNKTLLEALRFAKANNKPVHFIGLVSDGGVHSHIEHLKALCDIAYTEGCRGYIHAFTDGRDCDPKSGLGFLKKLAQHIENQHFSIATIIGRYYAMDRDKRWERVKLAYDLMVNGVGEKVADFEKVIAESYKNDVTDEFLKPMILNLPNGQAGTEGVIKNGDVVINFNFRTDRPREISEVLTQKDFPDFDMKKLDVRYVTMTRYDETYKNVSVLFEKDNLTNTIGEVIANAGMTQVRIAETEKYPHVTFFFSGGRESTFEGERRIMVASPKVATYDLQPEMSAVEITDKITADIEANQPNFICLNYANTDMVGHTGDFQAAMKAAETVSKCTERLLKMALKHNYQCIVIADHGNSDYMINEDGTPNTAHTLNPVPCIFVSKKAKGKQVKNGKLADIAPTILKLLGLKPAKEMDGENLIF